MRFSDFERRAFITLLGGSAAWPFVVHAQKPGKLPTIGFLGSTTPSGQNVSPSDAEKHRMGRRKR
jgi:hypothetical protein